MIQINVYREKYTNKEVIGTCIVLKNGKFEGGFVTLERPWLNNKKNESCIPTGSYNVEHWNSKDHPNTFHVKDVKDRDYILIHSGNFYNNTAGCILLGGLVDDINNDGIKDILHSQEAINILNKICKDETDIKLLVA